MLRNSAISNQRISDKLLGKVSNMYNFLPLSVKKEAKDTSKATDNTAVYIVVPILIILIIVTIAAVHFYRKTKSAKSKGKLSTFSREREANLPQMFF